jgi:hypothetical protein
MEGKAFVGALEDEFEVAFVGAYIVKLVVPIFFDK